ncbi:MAG: hypothetical protein O7G31_16490 [Calditrichaeota bacterium]|nr:hypothetical protein [Calditrichota bacterium]
MEVSNNWLPRAIAISDINLILLICADNTNATVLAHLRQAFPKHIGQETNQDMRLHTFFFLMPNVSEHQIVLLDSKRRRQIGQMNVGVPEPFVDFLPVTRKNPPTIHSPIYVCGTIGTRIGV